MQEYIQQAEVPIPSTSLRNPAAPEVNVTIPGMDKMASGLSNLSQAISQSPQKFSEEARQLVSTVKDQLQLTQAAHNVGFLNGAGVVLVLSLILYFVSSRNRK